MKDTLHGICRSCAAMCPLVIEREDGVPVGIIGDKHNPVYWGYTCIKGREMTTQLRHPDRLMSSVRKERDGSFTPIGSAQALDEIAAKLERIIAEHGPRAVATYAGTYIFTYPATQPVSTAWMEAIGSRMMFTSNTIDQPGKVIAPALHGTWQAGPQVFDDADTWLLVGVNPIVAHSGGVPNQNPAKRLRDAVARGMKPIVIDPRRTECAERAFVHLQPRPGEDPAVLAGMIRVILAENLFDADFVRAQVQGVEALRAAVEPFTPEYVAARADVPAADLVLAARTFAQARRGGATAGTGPNMSGHSNLVEYLLLALMSLCGRWLRAGERVPNPGVLGPRFAPRAQANAPWPVYVPGGETLRVRGFREAVVGLPVSALADEILLPGEGQVKALISIGGNPLMAWPDQKKTLAALKALDLFVCLDIQMAHNSCHHAHYTVACKHSLESPAMTLPNEMLSYFGTGFGYATPYAQYAPAAAAPPAGSDLVEEWEFFYGIAKRMRIELEMKVAYSWTTTAGEPARYRFDMQDKPSTDQLFEVLCDGGRVPLRTVQERPEGRVFAGEEVRVAPSEPGREARLQVGDETMCADLAAIVEAGVPSSDGEFPFRLISRRMHGVMNSTGRNNARQLRQRHYNPAFMNPADLAALGLASGDEVRIASDHDTIPGIVEADQTVKRGVISMSHCFGTDPEQGGEVRDWGANTGLLTSVERDYDRYSGIPRMSAIPVRVSRPADA